jgi:pyridoxamine 5'-phosphate oxidase
MTKRDIMAEIGKILDDAKTGLLATVDSEGKPHMRWLTPAVLRGRVGALYNVTAPNSMKLEQLRKNPYVQWMIQSRALDRIITVNGKINIVENPSIRTEVLEAVGDRLRVFWKIHESEWEICVLETIIEKATYYLPMKNLKETVEF